MKRWLVGGVLLAGAAGAAAVTMPRDGSVSGQPAALAALAHVPRMQAETVVVPEGERLIDFAGGPDGIFLLDYKAVWHVRRGRTDWESAGSFGAAGDGPGEFRMPSSIASFGDKLLVTDRDRLISYDHSGQHLQTQTPESLCAASRYYLVSDDRSLYVSGDCRMHDTITAVLYRSEDAASFTQIHAEPRFTARMDWGSIWYAARAASEGESGVLFGIGREPCVVAENPGRAPAAPTCAELGAFSFPHDLSPTGRPLRGQATEWPTPFPFYVDRVESDGVIAVWRPFSADSMVLQTLEPSPRYVMVAPLDGFVGCRRPGCAWNSAGDNGLEIVWLPAESLAAAITIR